MSSISHRKEISTQTDLEIAVIGMAGRFPGAKNLMEFWDNLTQGLESVTFFSDEELLEAGIAPEALRNPDYVKAKPFLDEIEAFDATFFEYSHREVASMDPQFRVFHECVWEALEDAGYVPGSYGSLIGLYAGTSTNFQWISHLLKRVSSPAEEFEKGLLNFNYNLGTRIAYKLNLKGPVIAVETACSTSLVAIHLACQGLLSGECRIAVAGGVSITLPRKQGYLYQQGMIRSADGHCRAFDAQAQGTIFGDGAGVVVLKPLEEALADGDCIHAVIKGSAVNNDGNRKVGYTAPSAKGQAFVIRTAQRVARVAPDSISYVETHGTGTDVGDPIEIEALKMAFKTEKRGFCAIGSVKSNVGHLNNAAGVAGFIKTVLALKHKLIPPSLHFETPNPKIDFANSPFYVNTKLSEWKTAATPRRAGVSSFGIGGTNAHVILEEAPPDEPSGQSRAEQLLLISAQTASALETATANLTEYLQQYPDINLADAAYTLQVGRRAFNSRRMVVCNDVKEAVSTLKTLDPKRVFTNVQKPKKRSVIFLFPGQGAQYVNMAQGLYQIESTFREQVDLCSELLKPFMGLDLRDILYPHEGLTVGDSINNQQSTIINQTAITQPAIFVIEYALARLWMEWGIRPHAVLGHSLGEYVAAHLAGVFSLEDALTLVAARGQLMQPLPAGTMLSVPLLEAELQPLLGPELSLAAVNTPCQCVVSGRTEAVEVLQDRLIRQGIACTRLHTSHAFHSAMMEPILEPFGRYLKTVTLNAPQLPWVSTVTGTWITAEEATDPGYWVRNVWQPVRFADGVRQVVQDSANVLLEVGPGRTLSTLVKQHPEQTDEQVILSSLRHPQDQQSDTTFLLTTLGKLWLAGAQVEWSGFYAHERRHRLPLPTYPFERQRYWIEQPTEGMASVPRPGSLFKNPNIAEWFYIPSWKRTMPPVPAPRETEICWFVFSNGDSLSAKLIHHLQARGDEVVAVLAGDQFTFTANRTTYTIHPTHREDYGALLAALGERGQAPRKIIHLWNVPPLDERLTDFPENALHRSFYSLLFLAQAIGAHNLSGDLELAVVSSNMQQVASDEVIHPEKACLLGPCRVIPQEMSNITCRSIDVVLPETGSQQETQLIEQLIAELDTNSPDAVIAYRGRDRWVQMYESVSLAAVKGEGKDRLRERGVYLITGGLGNIGLTLAEHLARTVRARLVLISRSRFLTPEARNQWLATHAPQDRTSLRIQAVQALEALGAEVLVVRADVTDQAQMKAAVCAVCERFGTIHGVIHAAGNFNRTSFRAIEETDKTECEQQFQPTIYGSLVLEKILSDKELDFCLLTSSLSSVLGGLGLIAYSAANNFLDAFARQNGRANPTLWISVNWDSWKFGEDPRKGTSFGASLDELAITSMQGGEVFQRILSCGEVNQLVISTADLQARVDQWVTLKSIRGSGKSEREKAVSFHGRPNLLTSYVAPRNEIERTLTDIWQKLIGIEQIGIHDNFFELGGDSLLGLQIMARANETGLRLTPQQLFQHQTIAELATTEGTVPAVQAEQDLVTGPLPLMPHQRGFLHEFLDQDYLNPHHATVAALLEVHQPLDPVLMERAVQHILVHHDALRTRFVREESGWRQFIVAPDGVTPFTSIDLSDLPAAEHRAAIELAVNESHQSLNLSEGPLLRVTLFNLGAQNSGRLLITLHHMVSDVASLQIVLDDFQRAYLQLSQRQRIHLPSKTTSFKRWTKRLNAYARSAELRREVDYWLTLPWGQVPSLPLDHPIDEDYIDASNRTVTISLSVEETTMLLREVPKLYNAQIEDTLLMALVQAVTRWSGSRWLGVRMVDSGRGNVIPETDDIDLSRTVGCLIQHRLLLLEREEADNPGDALRSIKKQLRRIPNRGFGYYLLLHCSGDAEVAEKLGAFPLDRRRVELNYLGQQSAQAPSESAVFRRAQEHIGETSDPRKPHYNLLTCIAQVVGGCLFADWSYSTAVHKRSTIERVAQDFMEALRALIGHCQSL